ncbi:MAG: hypothetical protein HQL57_05915 [Magnetococcales bacterium]|nr:hypothetical protein [Magnetococcales bacterium]
MKVFAAMSGVVVALVAAVVLAAGDGESGRHFSSGEDVSWPAAEGGPLSGVGNAAGGSPGRVAAASPPGEAPAVGGGPVASDAPVAAEPTGAVVKETAKSLLGRLFSTPDNRGLLDRMRNGEERVDSEGARVIPEEVSPPPEVPQGPHYVAVKGVIFRGDGGRAVWFDGRQAVADRDVSGEGFVLRAGPVSAGGVAVVTSRDAAVYRVKPGQTLDLWEGSVRESYEIAGDPSPSTEAAASGQAGVAGSGEKGDTSDVGSQEAAPSADGAEAVARVGANVQKPVSLAAAGDGAGVGPVPEGEGGTPGSGDTPGAVGGAAVAGGGEPMQQVMELLKSLKALGGTFGSK